MSRCNVRDEKSNWQCIHPKDHTGKCAFQFVPRIRLPKTQMALLRKLRALLKDVETGFVETEGYDILKTLKARRELIDAIVDLEELGRERASAYAAHGL